MDFEVIGPLRDVEAIATGRGIRELRRLTKVYGRGRWRKLKALATLKPPDGAVTNAEVTWYGAHGIGRR